MKRILFLLLLSSSLLQAQNALTERLQEEINSIDRLDETISIRIQMLDKVDAFEMHKEFVLLETPINERARQINSFVGGRDSGFYNFSFNTVMDKDDYVYFQVRNNSGNANITLENGSDWIIEER